MATEEIKKTQSIEKFENDFITSLKEQKFAVDHFKDNARFKITSQKKLEESNAVMTQVKAMKDKVKSLKENYYKPISDFIKSNIYNPIKELEDEIKAVEDFHKDQKLSWLKKIREEQDRKEKEEEEKLKKGETTLEEAGKKLEKVEKKVEAIKGITTRKVVKITNFAELPDEYKMENMPKINQAVLKDHLIIPGTQTVEEQSISNR